MINSLFLALPSGLTLTSLGTIVGIIGFWLFQNFLRKDRIDYSLTVSLFIVEVLVIYTTQQYWSQGMASPSPTIESFAVSILFCFAAVAVCVIVNHALKSEQSRMFNKLTEAYTREYGLELLNFMLSKARKLGLTVVLFYLDHDNFKSINDEYDHPAGNEVLKTSFQKLKNFSLDWLLDFIYDLKIIRLGGDEFILAGYQRGTQNVREIGQKICDDHAAEPFMIRYNGKTHQIHGAISVGAITISPEEPNRDAQTYIDKAEKSMYRAKRQGGGQTEVYNPVRDNIIEIIEQGKADPHFLFKVQGIYALDVDPYTENSLIGMEWSTFFRYENGTFIKPMIFFQILKKDELEAVTAYTLHKACAYRKTLLDSDLKKVRIHVNVSPSLIEKLEKLVHEALDSTGLPGKYLSLEITEYTSFPNDEIARYVLENIRKLGVLIFMDDVGAQFAWSQRLLEFRWDGIKIDQQYADKEILTPDDIFFLRLVTSKAFEQDTTVIVEGAHENNLEDLIPLGVQGVQSFRTGEPMTLEEFILHVSQGCPLPATVAEIIHKNYLNIPKRRMKLLKDVRIVAIDDNEHARNFLTYALSRDCSDFYIAETPEHFLREVRSKKPHIVVVDYSLNNVSESTGIELADQVRKIDPNIHIILYTGMHPDAIKSNGQVDEIISKDAKFQELLARLTLHASTISLN